MVMEEQQLGMELDSERIPVPQVQKPTEETRVETINKVTNISRGKPRLRKKALHAAILKQMEFYFGDANLSKDRFLGNLIKQDPYIDLNIFIRFNKIRELTTDTNRIAKALQASTMLSLSDDGTKVCRISPIIEKENIDDCTIYVQNLPPDADHEMLTSIFAQYGPVAYVSLPRYKSNKKIKGFAFVEFDKPESVHKCLKSFQKKGCVLPSYASPDDLLSITTFDDAEKDVTRMGKPVKTAEENGCAETLVDTQLSNDVEMNKNKEEKETTNIDEVLESNENLDKKKVKKRRHKESESLETLDTECSIAESDIDTNTIKNKKKKLKHSTSEDNNELVQDSDNNERTETHEHKHEISHEKGSSNAVQDSPKKSKKRKQSGSTFEGEQMEVIDQKNRDVTKDSAVLSSVNEEQDNVTDDKKKKRKRKRKSKLEDVSYGMALQVMAKKEWKHLRNKYLELQRSKMKQLKQHLRKTRWNQWPNYEKSKPEKEQNDEKEKSEQDTTSTCRFSFTPGVIVKIEMDKPCTDPKGFKMDLKGNSSVKYIDVKEGSYQAYVRCDTAEAAQLLAQKSDEERHITILQDEEEKMYWDKISQDREEKVGNKIRVKQRGRNKLLKKAEKVLGKHIKFDEV